MNHSSLRLPFLLPLLLAASAPLQAQDSLRQALVEGTPSLNFRYRFETVDSDFAAEQHRALASTLRTAFGYRTAPYRNFQAFFEIEDVANVWDDLYNSRVNGKTSYPSVSDPSGASVNQAYLDYKPSESSLVRVGRQELIYDNARFIGNVGWRQNHQSLDTIGLTGTPIDDLTLNYAYIAGVNTVIGGNLDASAHVLNAAYTLAQHQSLVGYYYHLDLEDAAALSSATTGLRYKGMHAFDDSRELHYVAEYAKQTDVGDNPNGVNADYYNLILAPKVHGVDFELALEHLGGSGAAGNKFTTPLATAHGFNGYADQFVVVPDSGLEDLSVGVGGELAGTACRLTYHMYQSDAGSIDYGSELNVTLTRRLNEYAVMGLKLAAFSADDAGTGFEDVTKIMFWTSYAVL